MPNVVGSLPCGTNRDDVRMAMPTTCGRYDNGAA